MHNFFSLLFYFHAKFADPPLVSRPTPHTLLKSTFLKFKKPPSLEILSWNSPTEKESYAWLLVISLRQKILLFH